MRRWMVLATFLCLPLVLFGCGSGNEDAQAQSDPAKSDARPLTIDAYDLALTRLSLPYVDVTGTYIENEAYAKRITEIGARRAAYFRLIDPDFPPITLVQFEMNAPDAIARYIAAQSKRLGISINAQPADNEFVSTSDQPDKPQWAIERRRNLIIIGDASTPSWAKAVEVLNGL